MISRGGWGWDSQTGPCMFPNFRCKLRTPVRSDNSGNTKTGYPDVKKSASNCFCLRVPQKHFFHPTCGPVNDCQNVLKSCRVRQWANQVNVHMFESVSRYFYCFDLWLDVPCDLVLAAQITLPCPASHVSSHCWPHVCTGNCQKRSPTRDVCQIVEHVENSFPPGSWDQYPWPPQGNVAKQGWLLTGLRPKFDDGEDEWSWTWVHLLWERPVITTNSFHCSLWGYLSHWGY